MSTPHLEERWITLNGELASEPQTRIDVDGDIIGGLEKFARVFRPGTLDYLRIDLEHWDKPSIRATWGWEWSVEAFVGGIAYRYAFDGTWNKWTVDHSYGYSKGRRPQSDELGIRIDNNIRFDSMFEIEVALLGFCCMSRGPTLKLDANIPSRIEKGESILLSATPIRRRLIEGLE